jgi:hypothetical protein
MNAKVISIYAADTSGVCSALYELGGMTVVHDASGCNSTYATHDEPRWYDRKSMIYISALTEADAVMGNDGKFIRDVAKAAGARVVGTGRSDFPNQVNNVVVFPGIFKGALESRATQITDEMKLIAANAVAGLVAEEDLSEDNILPEAFDERVAEAVSAAVKACVKH